ncbi:response regulator [Reyranella sp.]|uniref:response regulator n=1 Tax=Reyranella sp. TaxID=1929291 RepID=UPI00272F86D2|nr:response regulator [Reyranella sp.]MDP2375869.1 response regulator [Reyranella sp.]
MPDASTGRRVLVVEDEVIVGMLVEDMLQELGYEVVALSTHLDQAIELALSSNIDFAVLDLNLNGQLSYAVADVLRRRGLPFIFATGYGAKVLVPPYAGTPTLQKPFHLDDLRRILADAGL